MVGYLIVKCYTVLHHTVPWLTSEALSNTFLLRYKTSEDFVNQQFDSVTVTHTWQILQYLTGFSSVRSVWLRMDVFSHVQGCICAFEIFAWEPWMNRKRGCNQRLNYCDVTLFNNPLQRTQLKSSTTGAMRRCQSRSQSNLHYWLL